MKKFSNNLSRLIFNTIFPAAVALAFQTYGPLTAAAQGTSFKDSDWNETAYDNCGLPVSSGQDRSAAWVRVDGDRKIRITLRIPG